MTDVLRSASPFKPRNRGEALALLDLPATADVSELERRFRRLAHELHPDHGGDPVDFRMLLQARAAALELGSSPHTAREPLIVVHRGPWWRRLLSALAQLMSDRINPPPRRVQ